MSKNRAPSVDSTTIAAALPTEAGAWQDKVI
jgi:hypothetical protein